MKADVLHVGRGCSGGLGIVSDDLHSWEMWSRIKRSEWLFYSVWDEEESGVFCGNDFEETRPGIFVFSFSSSTMHLFPPPFPLVY